MSSVKPSGAPRARRLGRKLLLLLASVVLSCFLCEGIVRWAVGEQPKFPRRVVGAPFGLRINQPGATYRHKSADVQVSFRINSKGLRADREYPYEKPPGVGRIVCLGDSFTVGYEVELEDCFTRVMERELGARGYAVEVLDAGVSGYGTAEEYLYLERELIRYAPDVVVVSFYGNDLADNVRSDLFVLEAGELEPHHQQYAPLGAFGNFLNTNPLFSLLSERSDAFALFKESGTRIMKGKMVRENLDAIDAADPETATAKVAAPANEKAEYAVALAAALYEKLYRYCHERGIALVIQSIPSNRQDPLSLVELFPLARFEVARPRLWFLSGKELLDPSLGKELLYWTRSTGHWTPYSHRVCGRALANLIDRQGLLKH